jgi:hypothetical protein
LARAPIKIAHTLICIRADLAVIGVLKSHFLLSALVRDGGVLGESVLVGGGGPQGVSGAQCGLKHDRVGRRRKVKSEGTKGRERVC